MADHDPAVLSVWPTTRNAVPDPAGGMPSAIAGYAILAYTQPGDTVLDPDCGTGTTLIAALHAGRHAIGLTTHRQHWQQARAALTTAKHAGAWPDGMTLDATLTGRTVHRLAALTNRVDLVLTALTTPTPATRLTTLFTNCRRLLRPGRHLIITARPHRDQDGQLIDLPGRITAAAHTAGLLPVQRCIALTAPAPLHLQVGRRHRNGMPICRPAHHNVIVLRTPDTATGCAARPRRGPIGSSAGRAVSRPAGRLEQAVA